MEFIRYLHPKHFDRKRNCFAEIAFKKSSKDGCASLIDRSCIEASSENPCSHAEKFYPASVTGWPPVFWVLSRDLLPEEAEIFQKTSATGDECHYNLTNVSNSKLGKLVTSVDPLAIFTCDAGVPRSLTQADLNRFSSM